MFSMVCCKTLMPEELAFHLQLSLFASTILTSKLLCQFSAQLWLCFSCHCYNQPLFLQYKHWNTNLIYYRDYHFEIKLFPGNPGNNWNVLLDNSEVVWPHPNLEIHLSATRATFVKMKFPSLRTLKRRVVPFQTCITYYT